MPMRRVLLWAAAVSLAAGLIAPSFASAAFTPTIKFSPSSLKAGANPKINFRLAQDAGEEPIDKVTFLVPAGFRFPHDAAVADGEKLGEGQFVTSTTPFCSAPFEQAFPATARERDRTPDEIQQGVWVVWVVDLGAVKVDLVFSRLASGGWRALADVPNSPVVCPPATLTATLNETSSDSETPIWRNPPKPGQYTLKSIVESTEGSRYVVRQRIRFTK